MFRQAQQEDGFAMIAVIGVIALITVVAIGGFVLSQQVLHESTRVQSESRAFRTAESGLDTVVSGFNSKKALEGTYEVDGSTTEGTYHLVVTPLGSNGFMQEFMVQSTGYSEDLDESVTMIFNYMDLWNMNISSGSGTLGTSYGFNGNGYIEGPLYVGGDFEWGASGDYVGGPLFVAGEVDIRSGAATFGTSSEPILAYVGGDPTELDDYGRAYIDGEIKRKVPEITLPWIDSDFLIAAEDLAKEESCDNVMGYTHETRESVETPLPNIETNSAGGNPDSYTTVMLPGFNRQMSASSPASSYYKYRQGDLVIGGSSFGAWEGVGGYAGQTNMHDDFAFNVNTGVLYVEGTVYIDGDLTFGNGVTSYVGNGTIVVDGDVYVSGTVEPSGGLSASSALGIAVTGDVFVGANGDVATYHGAIFSNGTVTLDGSASANSAQGATTIEGAVLSQNIDAQSPNVRLIMDTGLSADNVLPNSMPAANMGLIIPSQWSRQ